MERAKTPTATDFHVSTDSETDTNDRRGDRPSDRNTAENGNHSQNYAEQQMPTTGNQLH